MNYLVGLRVVRDKRWVLGNHTTRPGSVGTMKSYSTEGSRTQVEVLWDNGTLATVIHPGSNSLLVLNTSQLGITHYVACSSCSFEQIIGYCWRCLDCEGINLCSSCYHKDKHKTNHSFERVDDQDISTEVGKRKNSKKVKVRGLFKGARVSLSGDSRAKNETIGRLEATTSDGIFAVHVKWKSKRSEVIKVCDGDEMTELLCIKDTSGGQYYTDHLPTPWDLETNLGDAAYVSTAMIRTASQKPDITTPKKTNKYVTPPGGQSSASAGEQPGEKLMSGSLQASGRHGELVKCPDGNEYEIVDSDGDGDSLSDVDDMYLTPVTTEPYQYEQVQAVLDFCPVSKEELGFYKDDIIEHVSKIDDEWWKGNLNGKCGIFASDYVKVLGKKNYKTTTQARRVDKIALK